MIPNYSVRYLEKPVSFIKLVLWESIRKFLCRWGESAVLWNFYNTKKDIITGM